MNHHMGKVEPRTLYVLLSAANRFSYLSEPAVAINLYLAEQRILTPNIRSDTGVPEAWRDYQQVLSELGLIYSTQIYEGISLTPIGLAYLDGAIGFSDVLTSQALRYQYPNGHKVAISPRLRQALPEDSSAARSLAEIQGSSGVLIRPAVLIWSILVALLRQGSAPSLTAEEIQRYVMRCARHQESGVCADAIITFRNGLASLPKVGDLRDVQEWLRFLQHTHLFDVPINGARLIRLSEFAHDNEDHLSAIRARLEDVGSFWIPDQVNELDRLAWFQWFGSVDISVDVEALVDDDSTDPANEFPEGRGEEERDAFVDEPWLYGPRSIDLSLWSDEHSATLMDSMRDDSNQGAGKDDTMVTYDPKVTQEKRRLHEIMVMTIADTCRSRGAYVWFDPQSVDLLVEHAGLQYLVEVKTVSTRNTIARLRYAIGQVLHYDYLLTNEAEMARRRVIALAARVPPEAWYVRFLNHHLDFDLVALRGNQLEVFSTYGGTGQLFASV